MSPSPQLPREPIHRISKPLAQYIRVETSTAFILLLFTIISLTLANSPLSRNFLHIWEIPLGIHLGSFEFSRSIHAWINDGLMTFFFFFISLELKRELIFGELRNPRASAFPIIAAIGGMLIPAIMYILIQKDGSNQQGWSVVMATDTAFVIGCLTLFGKYIPHSLRIFMLSVAILDDIGAVLVVAIVYSHNISWIAILISAIGFIFIHIMKKIGIRSIALYFFIGALIWFAIDASGIHPTVTGVILGLMTPTTTWISDHQLRNILGHMSSYPSGKHWSGNTEDRKELLTTETAAREVLSPLEQLEILLHPWIGYLILPLFALANAGVPISLLDFSNNVTIAIFLSLVLGKPIGILSFSFVADFLRIARRPRDLNWILLIDGSILAGIGFTMAFFIASLAFNQDLIQAARLGVLLASVFSALLGISALLIYKLFLVYRSH